VADTFRQITNYDYNRDLDITQHDEIEEPRKSEMPEPEGRRTRFIRFKRYVRKTDPENPTFQPTCCLNLSKLTTAAIP